MADKTSISWTEKTWNPIAGCSLASPGCTRCYAMKQAYDLDVKHGAAKYAGLTTLGVNGEPVWTGEIRFWEKHLYEPRRWKSPSTIFVPSMSDLFHEDLSDDIIFRILDVMLEVDRHLYQVLTKRPIRMAETLARYQEERDLKTLPDHIWWGTSVEDQRRADERIPVLESIPARVRFVSMEPLLSEVVLGHLPAVEWYIVGGESVHKGQPSSNARPFDPQWARRILAYCRTNGAAFHMKQLGSNPIGMQIQSRKGEDLEEVPHDLRIQETPAFARKNSQ